MKKNLDIYLLFIALFIGFLCSVLSCEDEKKLRAPLSKRMQLDSTSRYSDQNYRVYTLEDCEYIVVGYGKERWGSHKGNCKNTKHDDISKIQNVDSSLYQEKHFDCYVEDCYFDKQMGSYAITTECGILFYDASKYKVNEVLKLFKSSKHE